MPAAGRLSVSKISLPGDCATAACERSLDFGYAGSIGYEAAQCYADFIIVDLVAEVATGQASPKEAAARAEKRANRYYRV